MQSRYLWFPCGSTLVPKILKTKKHYGEKGEKCGILYQKSPKNRWFTPLVVEFE